ncbi:hypothetical protein [Paenibacillus piscarius]|uniref:hypothetical protein n=1 Tax=Paenibacillus piscarius TaxID=1089681 RepID=UPI001EE796C5|nr:hypothetical protein [Paenibacillus piscarius]
MNECCKPSSSKASHSGTKMTIDGNSRTPLYWGQSKQLLPYPAVPEQKLTGRQ